MNQRANGRFLLWVDAVGGYLVCRNPEVTLGQAIPGTEVDVPIMADISRQHASIIRCGEGYLLLPRQETRVEGKLVNEGYYLKDGMEIELGGRVRLRFRKPHPLSGTARLEFAGRHRTQPACDAVLLMADTCVLGPRAGSHVVCRDWPDDVVLFAARDGLQVRGAEELEVDGRRRRSPAKLRADSRVCGKAFSFCLEPVES